MGENGQAIWKGDIGIVKACPWRAKDGMVHNDRIEAEFPTFNAVGLLMSHFKKVSFHVSDATSDRQGLHDPYKSYSPPGGARQGVQSSGMRVDRFGCPTCADDQAKMMPASVPGGVPILR